MTFCPRLTKEVRSRLIQSRFIIRPYWTGSERSKPNSCRIWATVSGAALRPAIRAAGSDPGVAKKIRNTSTEMPNITNSICTSRCRIVAITPAPQPSLNLGSSASRMASPNTFSASTVSTMAIPGASATTGRE